MYSPAIHTYPAATKRKDITQMRKMMHLRYKPSWASCSIIPWKSSEKSLEETKEQQKENEENVSVKQALQEEILQTLPGKSFEKSLGEEAEQQEENEDNISVNQALQEEILQTSPVADVDCSSEDADDRSIHGDLDVNKAIDNSHGFDDTLTLAPKNLENIVDPPTSSGAQSPLPRKIIHVKDYGEINLISNQIHVLDISDMVQHQKIPLLLIGTNGKARQIPSGSAAANAGGNTNSGRPGICPQSADGCAGGSGGDEDDRDSNNQEQPRPQTSSKRWKDRDLQGAVILLLHTDLKRDEAIKFKNHLEGGFGVHVDLFEECNLGQTNLNCLEAVFDHYKFVMIFITDDFQHHRSLRYQSEVCITQCLKEDDKRDRTIVVWTDPSLLDTVKDLRNLRHIDYYRFLQNSDDPVYINAVQKIVHGDSSTTQRDVLRDQGSGSASQSAMPAVTSDQGSGSASHSALSGATGDSLTKNERRSSSDNDYKRTDGVNVLLLYTSGDRSSAFDFKRHLTKDFPDFVIYVVLHEEYRPAAAALQAMGTAFDDFHFVCLYITDNLTEDRYTKYMAEICLFDALTDEEKKERFIPVWSKQGLRGVRGFDPISGIQYHRYLQDNTDTVYRTTVINTFFV